MSLDLKRFLEGEGTYTTEDIKNIVRKSEGRVTLQIADLRQKIQALEETNKQILEKLTFLCENRKGALNLQTR